MENFYEEVYQYLIENDIDDDEATEVVNHLYEANIHEYGLLTENRGRAILSMLRSVGMMTGLLKNPAAQKTVKATTKKILQGTPRQGNLLTKTGKAQNFTGGRNPFTSTSPVPAASSKLPKPAAPASQAPGQMRIPGMSDAAMDISRITGKPLGNKGGLGLGIGTRGTSKISRQAPKPEFGPGAVKPPTGTVKRSLRPDGVAPKPEFGTPPRLKSTAKSTTKTNKQADAISALKKTQPMTAPKVDVPSAPQVKSKLSGTDKALAALGVGSLAVGVTGGIADKVQKDNARKIAQRKSKLAQQEAETRAADEPKPEPTGERSAKANVEKQEIAKKEAEVKRSKEQLSAAAKDFDRAFATARGKGKKVFTWRGKQYNTKYKGE